MSYLNVPRLNFMGQFQADPSTVNNNDANWNSAVQLSNEQPNPSDPTNGSVYWNPNGTHNWQLSGCTVLGAANDQGQFTSPSSDPIIGAQVLSNGTYPAKIVDLDPDNQGISQIWGLQIQVSIPDPTDSTKVLASVTATMPATAFGDLWSRASNAPLPKAGMPTMSAVFQAELTDVTWVNATASPLLAALQKVSPKSLSIRFIVDSFQPSTNQASFTYGRVVGTIGPVLPGDPPRSSPRRLAPTIPQQPSPIFSSYGPAGAAFDSNRNVLILDLGNCIPTVWSQPVQGVSVPVKGWPISDTTFQLTIPGPSVSPAISQIGLKSGQSFGDGSPSVVGQIDFSLSTYLTYAGIVEIPVPSNLTRLLQQQPMTLTEVGSDQLAVQEDLQGRYVDVDVPFFRLNPEESSTVTLWATKFGLPWSGASLDVTLQPIGPASNGSPGNGLPGIGWNNSDPQNALVLSTNTVTTDANGTGTLTLTAHNPGTPRMYPNGKPGPDGQVYWISGSWASWGQIFLFAGAPINVLVFSSQQIPANPTWTADVGPILSIYARLAPYMKGIIDLSDYDTVKQNIVGIQYVLNLPPDDPHFMPVIRDLSSDKLAIINKWINQNMPQ